MSLPWGLCPSLATHLRGLQSSLPAPYYADGEAPGSCCWSQLPHSYLLLEGSVCVCVLVAEGGIAHSVWSFEMTKVTRMETPQYPSVCHMQRLRPRPGASLGHCHEREASACRPLPPVTGPWGIPAAAVVFLI